MSLDARPPLKARDGRRARMVVALPLALSVSSGALLAVDDALFPSVVGFDLGRLNDQGLQGPPDGLRALDYEYCIPRGADCRSEVSAIDPSARFLPGSRGRIGCRPDQVLVLGNTHQPGFLGILAALARLPYVERIVECGFE